MLKANVVVGVVAACALVAACKKKDPAGAGSTGSAGSAGSAAASGAAGAGSTGSGSSGGSAAVQTAAGGAIGELPVVADCPKSLTGTEKVARTIKKACGPITVTGEYDVDGSLTLEAGVILQIAPGGEIDVGYRGAAKLIVQGGDAPDQRVVMTSAGDKVAGVWKGLFLYDGADRSSITGLDVEYAGVDGNAAVTLKSAVDVTFTKSTIKHAKDVGMKTTDSSFAAFTGNTFDDIGKAPMSVDAMAVGGLAPGNTFPKDSFIDVTGGNVSNDATWKNPGAPYHINGEVDVIGGSTPTKLTIADATLQFANDVELAVGYTNKGKLEITGPAVLGAIEPKPGAWKGIRVYTNGEATIDNLTVSDGGTDDLGAIAVKGDGRLTLGAVTFKANKLGLSTEDKSALTSTKPLTFSGNTRAMKVSATAFGSLGDNNVYDDGQIAEINHGAVGADVTWKAQPKAVVQITEEIQVDNNHTLTIASGTYAFKNNTELGAGYSSTGTLKITGTTAAPVAFTSMGQGDTWKGVKLYSNARGVDIANLNLSDVDADAGVFAKNDAIGKLDHVTCVRCKAVVSYECKAKLDVGAVTAGDGTKDGVKKPDGC